jgi:hypothetical protein
MQRATRSDISGYFPGIIRLQNPCVTYPYDFGRILQIIMSNIDLTSEHYCTDTRTASDYSLRARVRPANYSAGEAWLATQHGRVNLDEGVL